MLPSGRRVETATGVALIALGIVVASGAVTMPWLTQFPRELNETQPLTAPPVNPEMM